MLEKVHPGRAARCKDRQTHRPVPVKIPCKTVEHLRPLFHYGKVGCKVSIEHIVKSELPESGHHLACDKSPGREAELLPYRSPHRRSGLYYHHLVRICKILYQTVGVVPFSQRSDRTYRHALSAICALAVDHHLVERRGDRGVEPSSDRSQRTHCLHIVADTLASAAEDAFVHIADDRCRDLSFARGELPSVERHLPDIEPECKVLKLAVTCLRTGQAFIRMIGQYKFCDYLAGVHHPERTCPHDHPLRAPCGAGRSEVAPAFDLDHAYTARGRVVLDACTFEVYVAQGRYIDAYLLCSLQYCGPTRDSYKMMVYL